MKLGSPVASFDCKARFQAQLIPPHPKDIPLHAPPTGLPLQTTNPLDSSLIAIPPPSHENPRPLDSDRDSEA